MEDLKEEINDDVNNDTNDTCCMLLFQMTWNNVQIKHIETNGLPIQFTALAYEQKEKKERQEIWFYYSTVSSSKTRLTINPPFTWIIWTLYC